MGNNWPKSFALHNGLPSPDTREIEDRFWMLGMTERLFESNPDDKFDLQRNVHASFSQLSDCERREWLRSSVRREAFEAYLNASDAADLANIVAILGPIYREHGAWAAMHELIETAWTVFGRKGDQLSPIMPSPPQSCGNSVH